MDVPNLFAARVEPDDSSVGTVYIPDSSFLPQIWRRLGVTENKVEEAQAMHRLDDVLVFLTDFWKKSTLEAEGIKLPTKLGRRVRVGPNGGFIQYVREWISLPHLDKWFHREILGISGNENNPFSAFARKDATTFLPDNDYLPELYARLGVGSFEETGLLITDYESAWEGVRRSVVVLRRVEIGKELIGYSWLTSVHDWGEDGDVYYLDRLPEIVLNRLELRVKNLHGIQEGRASLSGVPRDILQAIATPGVRGRDLIGLCSTSRRISDFCNQNNQLLFRQRLLTEFNLDWTADQRGFPTPRALYAQLYKKHYVVTRGEYGGYDLDTVHQPEEDSLVRVVPNPRWPAEQTHYLFFFPDIPELSFVIHLEHANFDWELEGRHPPSDIVDPVQFVEFVMAILDTNEIAYDHWGVFGDIPELDWLLEALDPPAARLDEGNFLYVWELR